MLDEPFGALDQFTREELWEIMQDLWIETQPTVLLVTHDLKEAAYLASRICVMQARPGRIIDDSAVPFARPRTIDDVLRARFRLADPAAARTHRCRPRRPGGRVMNEALRRRIAVDRPASSAFSWPGSCCAWLFHVSDIVLPRPSQILVDAVDRAFPRSGRTRCRRFTRRWSDLASAS